MRIKKDLSIINTNSNSTNNNTNKENSIWLENLKKNEDQRKKDSQWFSMQPGEKTVLEFLPEFGPVMKDFDGDGVAETLRYEYKVVDLNNKGDGPKSWDLSKTRSEAIDYLLKQGHHTLKVERVGSSMKTKYHFTPIVATTSAAATFWPHFILIFVYACKNE
jgi:hypothetical protein